MDKTFWEVRRERLGSRRPSRKSLRMASGQLVDSEATWEGTVELEGLRLQGEFEVFDSGSGWTFLFGKPLQTAFGAIHDYKRDEVTIEVGEKRAVLTNQHGKPWWTNFKPAGDASERAASTGVHLLANTPVRRVHFTKVLMCNSFDKPKHPEMTADDREEETKEELAKTTRIEEVRMEGGEDGEEALQMQHIDIQEKQEEDGLYTCANSPGASATPVRGVFQHNAEFRGNGANPNVPETHDDIGMWWAVVEATEADRGPRHDGCERVFSTGAGATPARGVQMAPKEKMNINEAYNGERDVEHTPK